MRPSCFEAFAAPLSARSAARLSSRFADRSTHEVAPADPRSGRPADRGAPAALPADRLDATSAAEPAPAARVGPPALLDAVAVVVERRAAGGRAAVGRGEVARLVGTHVGIGVAAVVGVVRISRRLAGGADGRSRRTAEAIAVDVRVPDGIARTGDAGAARADVGRRARVAVVAGRGVVGKNAQTGGWVAGIVGADVAVAAHARGAGATSAGADVARGAGIAVVAGGRVVGKNAGAGGGIAGVGGADVAVAAHDGCPGATSAGAYVAGGAGIAVVAGGCVVGKHAAGRRVAGIGGADVAVVAGDGGEDAGAGRGIAGVGGAGAAVVAHDGCSGAASAGADVAGRAAVAVVAGGCVVGKHAAGRRVAGIGGADVAVVAGDGGEDAGAGRGIAGIRGAGAAVVAHSRGAGARAAGADVAGGAAVAVVACRGVVGKHAAGGRVAGVVGADVAVEAGEGRVDAQTRAGVTRVGGAGAAVVAHP